MFGRLIIAGMAVLALQTGAMAESATVEAFPPVVVQTFPTAGAQDVDPSIKEVRVTFSKEMLTEEMWSFVYALPAEFPKVAGEVRYLPDKRTCVLPVSLEPGKTYGIWINSKKHNAFRDREQNAAVPYLLVFKTRS